jgi:hypothetical protein
MHAVRGPADHPCHVVAGRVAPAKGGSDLIPLLLWILGVPGLIIILLLLLGVIHI